MSVHIYQIHYDEKTGEKPDPAFIPFLNEVVDDYFENTPMRRVYERMQELIPVTHESENEYIGITSWKANDKSHLTGEEIIHHIEKEIKEGTEKDVYIYCPVQGVDPHLDYSVEPPVLASKIEYMDIWDMHQQKGDAPTIDKALDESGVLTFPLRDKWVFCHNNFWVAKRKVFDEYCEKVLIPAMDWIAKQNFPKTYWHNSGRWCTHACFTLEGTFGAFLAHTDYSYGWICKRKVRGHFKFIRIDGYINPKEEGKRTKAEVEQPNTR